MANLIPYQHKTRRAQTTYQAFRSTEQAVMVVGHTHVLHLVVEGPAIVSLYATHTRHERLPVDMVAVTVAVDHIRRHIQAAESLEVGIAVDSLAVGCGNQCSFFLGASGMSLTDNLAVADSLAVEEDRCSIPAVVVDSLADHRGSLDQDNRT